MVLCIINQKILYYLKKMCEWRKKVASLNNYNKLKSLKSIFWHVSETVNFELINTSSIEDYDKGDYESDLVEKSSNEE